jgi:hypothetical protein
MDEAAMVNHAIISDEFGAAFGEFFVRVFERLKQDGLQEGQHFTARELSDYIFSNKYTAPVPEPSVVTLTAAEEGTRKLGELYALWAGIKNTVFTHILAHMSELVAVVRNIARSVIGGTFVGWAVNEDNAARASAEAARVRLEGNVSAGQAELLPYMRRAGITDGLEYTRKVREIIQSGNVARIREIGLDFPEFMQMLKTNGILFQSANKLVELEANSDVTLGKLKNQTAWTGGISPAEIANTQLEMFYTAMYKFRKNASEIQSTMFDTSVIGTGSILPYVSPDYAARTIQINADQNKMLNDIAEDFRVHGYSSISGQTIPNVQMSKVFPALQSALSKVPTLRQAVPELLKSGLDKNDIMGAITYLTAYRGNEVPKFDLSHPIRSNDAINKWNTINNLISSLETVWAIMDVPNFAPTGQAMANKYILDAQEYFAAETNEQILRSIVAKLKPEWTQEIINTMFGSLSVIPGSENSMRFDVTVKGIPDSESRVTGVIDNQGHLTRNYVVNNGNIIIDNVRSDSSNFNESAGRQ